MLARSTLLFLECFIRTALMLSLPLSGVFSAYGQPRQATDDGGCQLETGDESTVLLISGPNTLHLADGRMVHLAEILTPSNADGAFTQSLSATAYLRSNVLGRKVEIRFGGKHYDRYGATVAHIFVVGERSVWLQEILVGAGLAQVFPQPDNHACSQQLASIEEKARHENRGYWGLALFKVLSASDTRSILKFVQSYQIIEGEVAFVTHVGASAVLHFANDSRFGFTASVEPAAQRKLSIQRKLDDWQGQLVRIRGWVERKKGPTITISQPEQIELLQRQSASPNSQDNQQ
jgi:endonuclease YncB( thermonuclease family)